MRNTLCKIAVTLVSIAGVILTQAGAAGANFQFK